MDVELGRKNIETKWSEKIKRERERENTVRKLRGTRARNEQRKWFESSD